MDCQQALTVLPDKPEQATALLRVWEKNGGLWQEAFAPVAVTAGRNGFAGPGQKIEGDGKTPCGVYSLDSTFGYAATAPVPLKMPYRQCTEYDFWIDDSDSPQYNTWVHGAKPAVSHEKMRRDDHMYKYGIVIGYNTRPVVKGKGSAVFIHIWRDPGAGTRGCIAMAEQDLLRLLAWLEPARQPCIYIGAAPFR